MFCNQFWRKFKSWFKKVDEFLVEHVDMALEITTGIKAALDGPGGLLVVNIIPGTWDDRARDLLSNVLGLALEDLGFIKKLVGDSLSLDQKLKLIEEKLQGLTSYEKNQFLIKLASRLTAYFDGNRKQENEYDLLAQVRYSLLK